jgi:vacuolar-type H+-ATPase subunit D/Vma8
MSTLRVPPGRAGRLRLRRRLAAAERGADLLERKLHTLLDEQRARHAIAEASARAWREAAAEAERWLARALAAEGWYGLRTCAPSAPTRVMLETAVSMGVSYPARARVELPGRGPTDTDPGSAALVCAESAYTQAADAAVRAAVDQAAARALDEAVTATRRQVRTLQRHWIPTLQSTLTHLEFVLEQSDFEDGVRRRHRA